MEGVGAQSAALQTAGHAELHAPAPGAVWPLQPSLQPARGRAGTQGPVATPACPCGGGSLSARRCLCAGPHRGGRGLADILQGLREEWGWSLCLLLSDFHGKKIFFFFKFFFWPCRMACRISVSRAGIEPGPQQRKPRTLTTRPLRKPPFKSLSFDTFPEVLHRFELEKSGRPNSKA